MIKAKHERDRDCVVAGFRWYRKGDRPAVGSLLLGLFDDSGTLHHVESAHHCVGGEGPFGQVNDARPHQPSGIT
jgi:ATP-dependent DNA ligase